MNTLLSSLFAAMLALPASAQPTKDPPKPLNITPAAIADDKSVKYDYDIVYVRAPRHGDDKPGAWAEFSNPIKMEPGADLMVLHPDGSEEVLVEGKDGSVMDPYVSFDGQWVYYAKFIDARHSGSDIWKIHVKSRKTVKLTDQTFTPNTGAANWSKDFRTPGKGKTSLSYGVYNLGPCPVPGGRVAYTSNRNAYVPPRGYPRITLQLFVMDDDGSNIEQTGFLTIACSLHPVILKDGRLLFSTLESHAQHNSILWGIWSIHPDGTNWAPVVSAFATGGAPSGFHFQSQLSDETLIIEEYYNQNNSGFGTYFKMPPRQPQGMPAFASANLNDPRNAVDGYGGRGKFRMPFTPIGMEVLTRFTHGFDGPAPSSIPGEQVKARVHGGESYPKAMGKVTHPCGAPDNHLLTAYTSGPANHQYNYFPLIDSGIYLIKDGKAIDEPGKMLLIKNDPKYNEQWPRPLVPYKRIYGVDEPKNLVHKNDGKKSPHLPEGTPYGLVGTSSLYKRESAPGGKVPEGSVTAVSPDKRLNLNWGLQGSDAGFYDNSEIHAIRIVAQEPRTDIKGNKGAPLYGNHAMERLRILGEIPVRKFVPNAKPEGSQPVDPDGNPDTSFLARIPADQPFTFQTLDKNGMVLNMAQTWHQLRPGEIRTDCGGCHAHSQKPTDFKLTLASKTDYAIFDLTKQTPLLTDKASDESKRQWDKDNTTGLRFEKGIKNVEYFRDIQPIFQRSCFSCHEHNPVPLILGDDATKSLPAFGHDAGPDVLVPMTYFRLAAGTERYKPREPGLTGDSASRYIRKFQARRSLLVWKIFGQRMDGTHNDDLPSLTTRGDPKSLRWKGEPIAKLDYEDAQKLSYWIRDNQVDIDLTGSIMPPPNAIKSGDVKPLTDEDRRTIVRWIDLGCPIELDAEYNAKPQESKSLGWFGDDVRPTLTVTYPERGANPPLTRILLGMADAYSGLDMASFRVVADFEIDGSAAGENLTAKFKEISQGVWEIKLTKPIDELASGKLTVSVKDRQGNVAQVIRTFTVAR
jgi:Hydrazine synthase alpha subunit middle domain